MKFVCNSLVLSDAAGKVSKACASKTLTPILECIKISAKNDFLTLIAFDGELSIEKKIKAEILEEGDVCVNGKFFTDFIGKINGISEVKCSTTEKGLEIRYDDANSSLQLLPSEEFPIIHHEESDNAVSIKESAFKALVQKTSFCAATDDARPILKGCLIETEGDKIVSTALDGYRMAVSFSYGEIVKPVKAVCPARTLNEIARMLEGGDNLIRLEFTKNMLFVEVGDTVITSRLYLGEFVSRTNIFPTVFDTVVSVDADELIESIDRASVLIRGDKNNLISFDIKAGGIGIFANSDAGDVNEHVGCSLTGKEIRIAMNAKYISEALKALPSGKVKISMNSAISPFTVESEEDKSSAYLILPVRMG